MSTVFSLHEDACYVSVEHVLYSCTLRDSGDSATLFQHSGAQAVPYIAVSQRLYTRSRWRSLVGLYA